jgi:hypothetical protein
LERQDDLVIESMIENVLRILNNSRVAENLSFRFDSPVNNTSILADTLKSAITGDPTAKPAQGSTAFASEPTFDDILVQSFGRLFDTGQTLGANTGPTPSGFDDVIIVGSSTTRENAGSGSGGGGIFGGGGSTYLPEDPAVYDNSGNGQNPNVQHPHCSDPNVDPSKYPNVSVDLLREEAAGWAGHFRHSYDLRNQEYAIAIYANPDGTFYTGEIGTDPNRPDNWTLSISKADAPDLVAILHTETAFGGNRPSRPEDVNLRPFDNNPSDWQSIRSLASRPEVTNQLIQYMIGADGKLREFRMDQSAPNSTGTEINDTGCRVAK